MMGEKELKIAFSDCKRLTGCTDFLPRTKYFGRRYKETEESKD